MGFLGKVKEKPAISKKLQGVPNMLNTTKTF